MVLDEFPVLVSACWGAPPVEAAAAPGVPHRLRSTTLLHSELTNVSFIYSIVFSKFSFAQLSLIGRLSVFYRLLELQYFTIRFFTFCSFICLYRLKKIKQVNSFSSKMAEHWQRLKDADTVTPIAKIGSKKFYFVSPRQRYVERNYNYSMHCPK